MTNRRSDPNFVQVSGYLPKDLVLRFKQRLLLSDKSVQEGLEEAVSLFLMQEENEQAES
ncbi:MAG: hypothetical protein AAF728_13505 [Cyanobacteria bacterium P01_D01_bin.128]